MTYSLKDIETISWTYKFNLSEDTIKLINQLTEQVGSPNYVKTPNFNSNEKPIRKKKRNNEEIKSEDWEAIRNFHKTEIVKSQGIDKEIDNVRLLINKMTEKTYDVIIEKLFACLDEISKNDQYNASETNKIGYAIFNMATTNKFNSNIYAKLCSVLQTKYEFMTNIINDNISEFIKLFDNMVFVNPNDDYDKFCNMNIENEKRRAMSLFLTNLHHNKVIDREYIVNNMLNIHSTIEKHLSDGDHITQNEELVENLYIFITNIELKDDLIVIINSMKKISSEKHVGISNKCKFKCMDINDYINKKYK